MVGYVEIDTQIRKCKHINAKTTLLFHHHIANLTPKSPLIACSLTLTVRSGAVSMLAVRAVTPPSALGRGRRRARALAALTTRDVTCRPITVRGPAAVHRCGSGETGSDAVRKWKGMGLHTAVLATGSPGRGPGSQSGHQNSRSLEFHPLPS